MPSNLIENGQIGPTPSQGECSKQKAKETLPTMMGSSTVGKKMSRNNI